jgi:isoquinoline 1-oxidoreductase beta subunit
MTIRLSRRNFLASAAAALGAFTLGFRLQPAGAQEVSSDEMNAWLGIPPDETVTIRISRAEMGQGSMTGLAQLLAEELDCASSQVRTEFVLPGQSRARGGVYGDFQTGGSSSIRELQDTMRRAGATARQMLVAAAADGWNVDPTACSVAEGIVSHAATGQSTSYGRLAAAAVLAPLRVPCC